MQKDYFRLPRLYVDQALSPGADLQLSEKQAHYLVNVLRKKPGDIFRVFNGRDGEFAYEISATGKKSVEARAHKKIKDQPEQAAKIHVLFAPIKKQRMDVLVEKAVELGASDLHPVLTARTEVRKINHERLQAQVIEATEQCERMMVPDIHPLTDLGKKIAGWDQPLYWGNERGEDTPLQDLNVKDTAAFLIGPEGGFDDNEAGFLMKNGHVKPFSLGKTVYRSETACIICLTHAMLCRNLDS